MMQKLNNLFLGIFIGILIPVILYIVIVYPKMSHFKFLDSYYRQTMIKLLPILLTRCIFPNAIVFFLLIWRNQLKIAKGILISTAVLTGALVLINFVL
jgi:hypothetical protein